ncbi:ABC transporter ATP-binding protein/permease [Alphaproteobacteria bacterium]|nr:ABC transporter ATP-binding protein/permease [Alphaproteobacteria bacterium]
MINTVKMVFEILSRPMQIRLFWVCFFICFIALLEMIGVWLVVPVTTYFLNPIEFTERFDFFSDQLTAFEVNSHLLVLISFVAFYCMKALMAALMIFYQQRFAFDARAEIASKLMRKYLNQNLQFHAQNHSSLIIRNIIGEVGILIHSGLIPCLNLVAEFLSAGLILTFSFIYYPKLTLALVLIFSTIVVLAFLVTKSKLLLWGKIRQRSDQASIMQVQESLSSYQETKLYRAEDFFTSRFQSNAFLSARMMSNEQSVRLIPRHVIELIIVLVTSALAWMFYQSSSNSNDILIGLATFAAIGFRLIPSSTRIISFLQSVKFSTASLTEVMNAFHLKAEFTLLLRKNAEPLNKKHSQFSNPLILLKNVFFRYNPDTPDFVLKDAALTINKGDCIGIKGGSGSGKTTLINILMGFLKVEAGEVVLNLQGKSDPRDLMGYVSQNVQILDASLRENVAFGVEKALINNERVARCLQLAGLNKFLNDQPNQLEQKMSEAGKQMSAGQKQRVGIARALYRDKPILILDEVTSALDPASEALIVKTINTLKRKKTIIMISHKEPPLEICDKVYELMDGQLKECFDKC